MRTIWPAAAVIVVLSCETAATPVVAAQLPGRPAAEMDECHGNTTPIPVLAAHSAFFSGRNVAVTASIRDTGVHGMVLVDLLETRCGVGVTFTESLRSSAAVSDLYTMWVEGMLNELATGVHYTVVAEVTGTFVCHPEYGRFIRAEKLENLRWRKSPE